MDDTNIDTPKSTWYDICYVKVLGFFKDEERHILGIVKKGAQRPLSNFTFKFKNKIVASNVNSTGFIVEVTLESIWGEAIVSWRVMSVTFIITHN